MDFVFLVICALGLANVMVLKQRVSTTCRAKETKVVKLKTENLLIFELKMSLRRGLSIWTNDE